MAPQHELFTALLLHVTVNLLRDGFYALKRGAAPGVDGVSWQEYETDLDEKLADLHGRIHRGTYRALPRPTPAAVLHTELLWIVHN